MRHVCASTGKAIVLILASPPRPPTAHQRAKTGRVCVVGSSEMFSDDWVDKEHNLRIAMALVRWCLGSGGIAVDRSDAQQAEVAEYVRAPDTASLSERLRSCLQESEELPGDVTQLFETSLFGFSTSLVPEAVALFEVRGGGGEARCRRPCRGTRRVRWVHVVGVQLSPSSAVRLAPIAAHVPAH